MNATTLLFAAAWLAALVPAVMAGSNITISTAATAGGGFTGGVWRPEASTGVINVGDLLEVLAEQSVRIVSEFDHRNAGNISISAEVPLNLLRTFKPRTLRLEAEAGVFVNAPIVQNSGGDPEPRAVNLELIAGLRNGSGAVTFNAGADTGGGDLTMRGQSLAGGALVQVVTSGGAVNGSFTGGPGSAGSSFSTSGGPFHVTFSGGGAFNWNVFTSGGALELTMNSPAAALTVNGDLDARLGAGNGSVNVQSAGTLAAAATAALRSGAAGTVTAGAAGGLIMGGEVNAGSLLLEATGGSASLDIPAGASAQASGPAVIRAGNDVTVVPALAVSGGLTLVADSDSSGTGNAMLHQTITSQNAPISLTGTGVSAAGIQTNGGGVTLTALSSAVLGAGGTFTSGGAVTLNAGTFAVSGPLITSGNTVSLTATGSSAISSDVTTSGGNALVTLTGPGAGLTTAPGADIDVGGGAGTGLIRVRALNGSFSFSGSLRSGAGGIDVAASASGTVSDSISATGPVAVTLSGPAALLTVNAPVSSSGSALTLRSSAGAVAVNAAAALTAPGAGSVMVESGGASSDLIIAGTVTAGAGGLNLRAGGRVQPQTALHVTGPVTITANTDLGSGGDAVIGVPVTSQNAAIAVSGLNVSTSGPIDSGGGSLTISAVTSASIGGALATGGGTLAVNAFTVSLGGPAITSGGTLTATAAGAATVAGDLTSSGGNITLTAGGPLTVTAASDINAQGGAGTGTAALRSTGARLELSGTVSSGAAAVLAGGTGISFNAGSSVAAPQLDADATGTGNIDINSGAGLAVTRSAAFDTANGNITLNAGVTLASGIAEGLTFTAGGILSVNTPVTLIAAGAFLTLRARADVLLSAAVNTSGGNVLIAADSNGDRVGSAAISAGVTTGGGTVSLSGESVTVTSTISTQGGSFTLTGVGSGTISGSLVTSGGSLTAGLSAGGAPLTVSGTLDATGGAGTGNVSLRSLAGTVNLTAAAQIRAGGTAALTGETGVTLSGDIPAAAVVDLDCTTGNIAVGATCAITGIQSAITMDAANSLITLAAGAVLTPGAAARLHLQVRGTANSLTIPFALTSGGGGLELLSDNSIVVSAPLSTPGPILLRADTDSTGGGTLTVGASVTGGAQPVTLRGAAIAVNAVVDTGSGEIQVQPAAAGVATIAAGITGPCRVVAGTARFTTGSVSGNSLTVNSGAALEFDSPVRSLSPAGFSHAGAASETRLRLGGTAAGQFNRIAATGAISAAGVLTVSLESGFAPARGQSFDLFDFTSFSGSFASVNLPALGTGLVWDRSLLPVTGVIRVLSPVELWRQQNFGSIADAGIAADTADPDRDGIPNLMEYALGLNPNLVSPAGLPVAGTVTVNGLTYLKITFNRSPGASDVSFRVQAGGRVTAFSDGSLYAASGSVPVTAVTTEVSRSTAGGRETIVVRDNVPVTSAGTRFLRLKVTRP